MSGLGYVYDKQKKMKSQKKRKERQHKENSAQIEKAKT